jgi:hypothetical protein
MGIKDAHIILFRREYIGFHVIRSFIIRFVNTGSFFTFDSVPVGDTAPIGHRIVVVGSGLGGEGRNTFNLQLAALSIQLGVLFSPAHLRVA